MNTTRLFLGLIALLLVSQLISCMDHRFPIVTPGGSQLRVKTITQQLPTTPNVSTVSVFYYDGQKRLSSILAFQLPDSSAAPVENTVYQYDSQNRLTQVQHSVVRRGSSSETYTLTYNTAGQLSTIANSPSSFSISFDYNAANQPSGFGKRIRDTGGLIYNDFGSLTFTGSNLTSTSETASLIRLGEPRPIFSGTTNTTYTFDDKLNPFYGVFTIPAPGVFIPGAGAFGPFYTLYGGIDNRFNASQNNVLTAVASSNTTYTYTYNAANLPITRTTTTGGSVTEVLRYDYESY